MSSEGEKSVSQISYDALETYDRMFQNKEWPGYKRKSCESPMPFLIMELSRLIPFIDVKNKINFHPINMPEMKIKQICIVGRVVKVTTKGKIIELNIEDGTGQFSVVHLAALYNDKKTERKNINIKHTTIASEVADSKPWPNTDPQKWKMHNLVIHEIRPPIKYDSSIPIQYRTKLEHDWWVETRSGLLGKDFEVNDRVSVRGYIGMDFELGKVLGDEITTGDLPMGKLFCYAMEVRCVTEHKYNRIIRSVICKKISERYHKS